MSADGTTGEVTEQSRMQPGHPNLWRGGPNWEKGGPSPNPTGVSKYQTQLRKAIEAKESPERVLEVIDAMRTMALSGNVKGAPAAAKVYLGAVGLKMETTKVDLTDAPPEVMEYLRGKIQ